MTAPRLNAAWHTSNRMPKNATFEQRIAWHAAHVAHCACRKPTGAVLEELQKRGLIDRASQDIVK